MELIVIVLCTIMAEEKSISIIEFPGVRIDWDGWSEKFLVLAKCKGYKKLLMGKRPGKSQ